MTRLTPMNSAFPLVTGIVTATALSGAAVLAVLQSGCDEPGSYHSHDGVVELIGGCLQPGDLPVSPRHPTESRPLGSSDPSLER
ncbi:hypothetical protein [Saccharopolyspora phatthalungensis]|uniref:Secreted protein n=1 Tax=Saccharopolyspora phatthalungensis TaxID=664693 RepID=A0A840PT78_9PSEU|nr:hypothetical protein [Saccharopolyspora phatthalungensis]MBB5153492.1 hypothetical protein [Saccharopolyspora phatthalungensis]